MKQPILLLLSVLILSTPSLSLAVEYSLDDLYRLGLERSERIKISEEDLFIAERGKDKALSFLFPKLSTYGSYTKYTEDKYSSTGSVVQPETSKSWGLRLDQSFTLNGKELSGFKISKENIEKSEYDLQTVKEDFLLTVASTYYDVLKFKKAVEIARANLERLTKHRDAAAVRLKVGEVTKTDLLRAEAELSGAKSELVRAENNLKLTRAVLARIVGIEGDYELRESQESIDLKDIITTDCKLPTIDCLKRLALSERAELKSLELQKKIAEDQVRYMMGGYWPTLSIEGVYSRKDEEPASTFFNKESIYGGLKLNFPFFEGGLRRAEVREAEARQRQAELQFIDFQKTIKIDVENSYLVYLTQEEVLKSLEDQLKFAKDNYNSVSKQYEFGLASSIDAMDANTLLVTAERQLADAGYHYQLSFLKLKKATGILLETVVSQQSSVVSQNLKER